MNDHYQALAALADKLGWSIEEARQYVDIFVEEHADWTEHDLLFEGLIRSEIAIELKARNAPHDAIIEDILTLDDFIEIHERAARRLARAAN